MNEAKKKTILVLESNEEVGEDGNLGDIIVGYVV